MMKIRLGKPALLLLAAWTLHGAEPEIEPDFRIRGDRDGNLWQAGETVRFLALPAAAARKITEYRRQLNGPSTPEPVPPPAGWRTVTGTVVDSDGVRVAVREVGVTEFFRSGWSWRPDTPGFYRVAFTVRDEAGRTSALVESLTSPRGWTVSVPPLTIRRRVHDLAVLPERPGVPGRGAGFGVCLRPGQSAEAVNMLPAIGFEYVRLHWIAWNEIEKERGRFDWKRLDDTMAGLRRNGIGQFVGNVWGTPRWASSRPDAPGKGIWDDYAMAYAPARIEDFTAFLAQLLRRYPDIGTWEIWNEPHLPGQSIFWRSSPEEYVAMLKAGYAAIKRVRPGDTVWLGGIGMRYLPFYRRIMELGAGDSFDVLPLHGRDVSPEPFDAIDRRFGVAPKPWVQGEWHTILFKTAEAEPPSERRLARNMLFDLMTALQRNVSKVTVWNWAQGTEREFHAHFHRHGEKRVSIGGMFRCSPCYEPRLPLVVLNNFINCCAGRITVSGSYALAAGTQQAVLLKSAAGRLLAFWQNGVEPAVPAPELVAAAAAPGSVLLSWEGKPLTCSPSFRLQPEVVYWLKSPPESLSAEWGDRSAPIQIPARIVLKNETFGTYRTAPLFRSDLSLPSPPPSYEPLTDFVSVVPAAKGGERKPSGRFAVALSGEGLDLLVEVNDPVHVQNHPQEKVWSGDSVQFALDAVGKGRPEDRIEFSAALTRQGALLRKEFAPLLQGDLPARYTDPPAKVKYGQVAVEHHAGRTVYRIRVSRNDLYPFTFQPGQPVRFALLVNDNNGGDRRGYLEWASGIGNGKKPAEYGNLSAETPRREIFSQRDLKVFRGDGRMRTDGGAVRVEVAVPSGAARLSTPPATVTGGTVCRLYLAARGTMAIRVFAGLTAGAQSKPERFDLIEKRSLRASEWTEFRHTFMVPPGTAKLYLTVFGWKEKGFFEIRDFRLETGR